MKHAWLTDESSTYLHLHYMLWKYDHVLFLKNMFWVQWDEIMGSPHNPGNSTVISEQRDGSELAIQKKTMIHTIDIYIYIERERYRYIYRYRYRYRDRPENPRFHLFAGFHDPSKSHLHEVPAADHAVSWQHVALPWNAQ